MKLFEVLYFSLQRALGGVHREMVHRARKLLEAPSDILADYVQTRLEQVHGCTSAADGWLGRQPLVDRVDLLPQIARLTEAGMRHSIEKRKTSGSTGTPFAFYKDREMTGWMDAAMWAAYSWHGIAPGARQARFWGVPRGRVARTARRVTDFLQHRRRFDAFAASPATSAAFFHELRRFRPEYAYGYPSLLRSFAAQCTAKRLEGRDLGIRKVICTGEILSPDTRRVLAEFFDCRIVNEYGCTESGLLAFECEAGTPHVIPVAALPEVVTSTGERVAQGDLGEVVVTDLYGGVLPLLRYRLHDRGAWGEAQCVCGRSLRVLQVDRGRIDSFIQTPHRGPVYDAILAYTVPPQVGRFKAVQVTLNQLVVDVVPGPGFTSPQTTQECQRRWEAELGPSMRVSVRVVDNIPPEPSGKLRYFVPLEAATPRIEDDVEVGAR
jgi:phenylacetate-coenzyme A ligase PaaK-like adenylate-forming protein